MLTRENDTLRNSETEALKKVDEANKELERMRQEHLKLVDDMGHRNAIVTAEKDKAFQELAELKAKYDEVVKEKDEANKIAQEACDQTVEARN